MVHQSATKESIFFEPASISSAYFFESVSSVPFLLRWCYRGLFEGLGKTLWLQMRLCYQYYLSRLDMIIFLNRILFSYYLSVPFVSLKWYYRFTKVIRTFNLSDTRKNQWLGRLSFRTPGATYACCSRGAMSLLAMLSVSLIGFRQICFSGCSLLSLVYPFK